MAYNKGDIGWDDYYKAFVLPHSCDEWVIGGLEEMLTLESDLKEAIRKVSLPHTPELKGEEGTEGN